MAYAVRIIEGSAAVCAKKNDRKEIVTLFLDKEVLEAKRRKENLKLKTIISKQSKLDKLVPKFNRRPQEDGAGERCRKAPIEAFLVEYQKQRQVTKDEIKSIRKTLKVVAG